jgi:type I restriction enzyme S subunit
MKWDAIRLGEVIDIKHGYAFKSEYFTDSGQYVLLSPGSCDESGGLKLKGDREKYYNGEFPSEFLLDEGDLLVVMTDLVNTAPILGGSFLIPESNRFLHNQRLGLVQITDEGRIDKKFLYYLLNTHDYRAQVRGSASGATVRHSAPGRIKDCMVRVPRAVAYQRQIAGVLSAYDDLIANNRRRMELLEESAQLQFQEWFVRLRFPGHEHTRTRDGVPKGWSRLPLESVCLDGDGIQTGPFGSQLHQSDYNESGVPVVMPKDLISFRIAIEEVARIPESLAEKLSRHRMIDGDTVYGRRGDIGRRAFVSARQVGWICGTGCLRIRPNPAAINPRFLFDALGSPETAGTIASRAKGATMPNLNSSVLKSVPVLVAPRRLQDLYSDHVEPVARMVELLSEQNQKLKAARDLLLPRLISGEVPV